MLLECRGAPVTMDKKPLMQNIRLSLPGNQQFRLKLDFLKEDNTEEPVDLVAYRYSKVELDGFSPSITINGEELKRHIRFDLKLSYDFLKHTWRMSGKFGKHKVDKTVDKAIGLLIAIKELL